MSESDNDPWTVEALTKAPAVDDPKLVIDVVEGVEPLDDQFGAASPKTVPDALYQPLFGPVDPSEAEIEAAGGDPKHVPPMQTYAILDAAKLVNLQVILDTSGLEHRCLFKGEAYDELKDVAPYIVRLEEGNDFTRHLFTVGKAPWCMWDIEPGIYVRSRGTLDDMWRHFRKFTRVQDEAGKWYYFRFWDGVFWTAVIEYPKLQKDTLFIALKNKIKSLIFNHDHTKQMYAIHPVKQVCKEPSRATLNKNMIFALNLVVNSRRENLDIDYILENSQSDLLDRNEIAQLREWLIKQGFKETKQLREALLIICQNSLFYEDGKRNNLYQMLADQSRGAGVRLWFLKNRDWN